MRGRERGGNPRHLLGKSHWSFLSDVRNNRVRRVPSRVPQNMGGVVVVVVGWRLGGGMGMESRSQ